MRRTLTTIETCLLKSDKKHFPHHQLTSHIIYTPGADSTNSWLGEPLLILNMFSSLSHGFQIDFFKKKSRDLCIPMKIQMSVQIAGSDSQLTLCEGPRT